MNKLYLSLFTVWTILNIGFSQNLTITSSGDEGPMSGTNWSISGNSLTVSGLASIRALVIETALANGPLSVVGTNSIFAITVNEAISVATGGNNLSFGIEGNAGGITINQAITVNGDFSVFGGTVTINKNVTSTASNSDILVQARNNIVLTANNKIGTNAGDITLRANAGGTAVTYSHAIWLNTDTGLLSNGGNITLGGNFDGTEGVGLYAATGVSGGAAGIRIDGSTIAAAGGNIKIYGRCTSYYDDGIRMYGNVTTTGNGTIGIYGDAYGGFSSLHGSFYGGITISQETITNITTEGGNVVLRGILTNSNNTSAAAINFYRKPAGGSFKHIQILSKTGDIEILGDEGTTGARGINHFDHGNLYIGSPENASWIATGDVRLVYSKINLALNNGMRVRTRGKVSYEPVGTSFTSAQNLPASASNIIAQDASSLTIGKPLNTANITVRSAQWIAGPVTLYGENLAINGAITAFNNTINLHATGSVTQSAALTANGLGLHGTGAFTLTNTSNNVVTIAGGDNTTKLGSLSYVDASGGLTIGTVNPNGITASGPILIETLTGDITVSNSVTTTDTTSDAIIINAGKTSAIGNSAGGDIMISGHSTIMTGVGGIAKLFSGSGSASKGLTMLAGSAANVRYHVDETTASYSPPLQGNNVYVLYRVASPPDDPTDLVPTPGIGEITINFTSPADDGGSPITNYEYTIDGGITWIPFSPAVTGTTVTVTNLTCGTTYTMQLRAVNAVGAGVSSTTVTATIDNTVTVTYTGVIGATTTNKSSPITLSASVTLPSGADASQSQLRFVNRDSGQPISGWLAITPGSPSNIGTATYVYTFTLGTYEIYRKYNIGIEFGNTGCFNRNNEADNVHLTLAEQSCGCY